MYKFGEILMFIWQLPQNILGLLLLLFYGNAKKYYEIAERKFYYTNKMPSGISLGNYIIMNYEEYGDGMKHEFGHSVQSRILGPLYLIVIGLPSLLGNVYDTLFHSNWPYQKSVQWYYNQPWEKWADKLGGVVR